VLFRSELLARRIRERLERVLGAGQHMQTLVRDLHDLAALEGGRLSVRCAPLDLACAAREARDLMEDLAATQRLQLSAELDTPTWVQADALRLRQVLLNLLGNALKFTPPDGQVSLHLSTGAHHALLEVRDSGPGMDALQLSQLFVPFARLGAERRGIEGSGLGLALSRGLVEAMGGRIGVRSAPGQGTRIVVELPLVSAMADAPTAASGSAPPATGRITAAPGLTPDR
jgi:signal transduction histidine kinase